jgi:hypothetical protein
MDRGVGTNRPPCLERRFAEPLAFDEAFDPLTRG